MLCEAIGKRKVRRLKMLKYSLKRILLALVTAFIILTLTFFLVKSLGVNRVVSPDSWVRFAYYQDQVDLGYVIDVAVRNDAKYGELLEEFNSKEMGTHFFYQKPIFDQYISWLTSIVTRWDWGRSTVIEPNSSAIHIIFERLPTSFSVNIISVVIAVIITV